MPSHPRSWSHKTLRKLSKWLRYQYRVSLGTIATIEGIQIRLGRHMSPQLERAISRGGYERDQLRLIGLVLSPRDVVLEVGAGLGVISAFCAKRIGSERVFACEANPDLEPRIRETYALNDVKPTLEMCAVSATAGRVIIHRSKRVPTSSMRQETDGARSLEVPGKAIGYLVDKVRPTLLIIDNIDGAEAELFDQAQLDGVTKIVLGLRERTLGEVKARRVRAALTALGFHEDPRFSSRDHLVWCR
jgi:FkbM family methyltransferase